MVVNGAGFAVISFLPFLGPGALCCWSTVMVILLKEAAPWSRQIALCFSISCFPRGSKMLRKLATKHCNKIWSWFPLHFHPRSRGDPRERSWKARLQVSVCHCCPAGTEKQLLSWLRSPQQRVMGWDQASWCLCFSTHRLPSEHPSSFSTSPKSQHSVLWHVFINLKDSWLI